MTAEIVGETNNRVQACICIRRSSIAFAWIEFFKNDMLHLSCSVHFYNILSIFYLENKKNFVDLNEIIDSNRFVFLTHNSI